MIFLDKLNHLELWGADIGNAYLEAFTDEKLYIVAGPEFQELEGYILIFLKALYGLKSSGKRWAEVIHGIMRDMKLLPSKADPCIWLRKAPNLRCYEYIAVYVDDLCIAAESPNAIIQIIFESNPNSLDTQNTQIINICYLCTRNLGHAC